MGIALNRSANQSVNWWGAVDANWSTIESSYYGRLKSDTSVVTVTGTTSETVLMNNTTVPANTLSPGVVLSVWAAGTIGSPDPRYMDSKS
jgi:hypothetical protein